MSKISYLTLNKKLNSPKWLTSVSSSSSSSSAKNLEKRNFANSSFLNVENLRGIFPTVTTPFKRLKNEAIAWKDLEKNLVRLAIQPFAGYTVNGFYGEYPYLSKDERLDVVRTVRSIVGRKKTIIAGASSESLRKTIEICELMKESGADYSLLFTPHYFKKQMTYYALLEYYTKVADKSPIPILLYNIPSVSYIDLPADLCIELADHPNIVGLKEASHNIAKMAFICEHIKHKTNSDFSILVGSASFLLEALRVGAVGGVCALANVLGPQLIELYNLYEQEQKEHDLNKTYTETEELAISNKLEKAQLLQNRLVGPDLALTERFGVPGLKAALDAHGFYGGPCRLPLLELNEEELSQLKDSFLQNGFQWSSALNKDAQSSTSSNPTST